jgi:hypothetical protein
MSLRQQKNMRKRKRMILRKSSKSIQGRKRMSLRTSSKVSMVERG